MPQAITPLVRPAAPIQSANDAAATSPDLIQLHAQAVNGLAEALHVLRHGDLSSDAMHRAIGRAIRGTTALKRLAALEGSAA